MAAAVVQREFHQRQSRRTTKELLRAHA
eukprot:COSAG06_NODE_26170_length_620_cov_0.957774_2_plen_27_part_01